jgi:hypothetical protein
MKLTEDIRGLMDGTLYGKQGDTVTVKGGSGSAMIVEAANGERFPVNVTQLTEEDVTVDEISESTADIKSIINQAPAKKKTKATLAPKNQSELF